MKARSINIALLLCILCLRGMSQPGYHFNIDFSNESSDNIGGWVTNARPDHPKGGVAVSSNGYARFRNAVAAMKTSNAFSYAGTLSFKLTRDSYGINNPTFKVYTAIEGADWDNGWTEIFASSYDDIGAEGKHFNVEINSGTEAIYLKLESVNDDDDNNGTEYSFRLDDLALTDITPVEPDNVEVAQITASCLSVSSEIIVFEKDTDGVYLAHDSIGFDSECKLSCIPVSGFAHVEELNGANPYPGKSDTAVFLVTSEDKTVSKTVTAVISRSVYQSKFGILSSISNSTSVFDGWTFGGKRYPSSSKGNGGAYPGTKAMRLYDSSGQMTTPKFSSVGEISFVAKFSKTDGEQLKLQYSHDGSEFIDLKTFTPGNGKIPTYAGESINDSLSDPQTVLINKRDVFLRFQYVNGNSTNPRTMIDDIACKAMFDPDEKYEVKFKVYDFDNMVVQGASVTLGNETLMTDENGVATFTHQPFQMEALSYSVHKTDFPDKSGFVLVKYNVEKKVVLVKKELDIFLALGQSNMAGRGDIGENTVQLDGAFILDDHDAWVPAENPMNIYSNIRKDLSIQKLGPSYSFAQTMAKFVDNPICLIVNARGGTSITAFSEGGVYFEPMMERIRKANIFGTVKAAIWHQGESNSSSFASYLGRLNALVETMRKEVDTNFYFVAGQLGGWGTKYEGFNTNLTGIQNQVSNSDYVGNDRLWHIGDETHFNTFSQLLLGMRYAQKVLYKVYDVNISIFDFTLSDQLYITDESDTIDAGENVLYARPWDANMTFKIHAPQDKKFKELTINGTMVDAVEGETTYSFVTDQRDVVFNIVATYQGETSSLNKKESGSLSFYPNPVSDKLVFSGSSTGYEVIISDISGRILMDERTTGEINIKSLDPGTYILNLESGENSLTKQLIKL